MLDLVIANTAEAFAPLLDRSDPGTGRALHERDLAGRALFWGGPETIVVAPEPNDPALVKHAAGLMACDLLEVWHPARSSLGLCADILADPALLVRLSEACERAGDFRVRPYAVTPEFCELSERLGWGDWRDALCAAAELDSKAGFRRIFECSELALPEGTICGSAEDTAAALHAFANRERAAAVKVHNGESGWGLRFFDPMDGRLATHRLCERAVQSLFASESVWAAGPYVVEQYVDCDRTEPGFSPSGEGSVDATGVRFDYLCDQLVNADGEFAGVSIGHEVELSPRAEALRRQTLIVGEALRARSYRGTFDVDFIIDRAGEIFAVECNARITGGTHVIGVARALFGEQWRKRSFVSNDAIRYDADPIPAAQILARLDALLMRRGRDRGIIVSFVSVTRPVLGAIAVGSSREDALSQLQSIEQMLVDNQG